MAADAVSWTNLYLTALQQAGVLRPVDVPPQIYQDPHLASLTATLAAGILAGPAGDQILTDGNLPAFFAKVRQWYGDDPTVLAPGVVPGSNFLYAAPPSAAQLDLHAASPTHSESFKVYVRYVDGGYTEGGPGR